MDRPWRAIIFNDCLHRLRGRESHSGVKPDCNQKEGNKGRERRSKVKGNFKVMVADASAATTILDEQYTLWSSDHSGTGQCPSSIAFSTFLPARFEHNNGWYPLPPSYFVSYTSSDGVYTKMLNIHCSIVVPFNYCPRTCPTHPLTPPESDFPADIKVMPEEWHQLTLSVNPRPKLFTPTSDAYALDEPIPVHVQLTGAVCALREILPDPAIVGATPRSLIEVTLVRQMRLHIHGSVEHTRVTASRAVLLPMPPSASSDSDSDDESASLEWAGELRVNADVAAVGRSMRRCSSAALNSRNTPLLPPRTLLFDWAGKTELGTFSFPSGPHARTSHTSWISSLHRDPMRGRGRIGPASNSFMLLDISSSSTANSSSDKFSVITPYSISVVNEREGDASVVVPSCKSSKRTRKEGLDLVSAEDEKAEFIVAYSGDLEDRFAPAIALWAICVRPTVGGGNTLLTRNTWHLLSGRQGRWFSEQKRRTVSHHQPVNRHVHILTKAPTSHVPVVNRQGEDTG
ncbi:hypothetical protein K438DRAFT_1753661 [Mycena galopus ATCC 62051]|nr:hypothetical protein K438DRAFT_1753661 [Mycena galopus ATCC 62051]